MRYVLEFPMLSLLCLALLVAACTEPDNDTDEPDRPEPRIAEVDLTIGVVEGEEPYMFGRILGVTVDDDGRIYVADWQADEIRAFDQEGQYLFTIGGPGEGPGELDNPCCLTIDDEGTLWVRDDQNRRYNRYRIEDERASHTGQISMDHQFFGILAATTFDADGNLIDVGSAMEEDSQDRRRARLHRTADGETSHTQFLPEAPPERVDQHRVEFNGGSATYSAPFGAGWTDAHGPHGDWAYAITDRYEVVRFDKAGDTLHVIERSVQGPRLSDEERESARNRLRQIADQFDQRVADLPFGVPERKPPLQRLFFDAEGRLWVQRAVTDGADNEADVYDEEGNLVEVVQWPSDVSLHLGAIRDGVAYGIRGGGGEDVDRVVRLRF